MSSPRTASARTRTPIPLLAAVASAALALTAIVAPAAANAAVGTSPRVLINEVYGGGGNSGATLTRDFIELHNASGAPVDLAGWSVQYASASGSSWQVTPLTGIVDPGESFLVGEALGAGGTVTPEVDVSGSIAMSGTSGKVALVTTASALGCGASCTGDLAVVDFVGYGAANNFAGAGPAPGTSNTTSASRNASHTNTANNAADFTAGAPTPEKTAPEPEPEPDPVALSIAEIQGTGAASPVSGTLVTTTGVVTASYPTGRFDGFVIQTPGTGGALDLATHTASQALFVYAPTLSEPQIGTYVEVTGPVTEFNGLTELTASVITALPDQVAAPSPATVSWPTSDAQRETLESMLLQPQGKFTVADTFSTNQYGEVGLAAGTTPLRQPTDAGRPGSPEATAVAADNAARRVTLDDGSSIDFLRTENSAQTPPYVSLTEPVVVGASVAFTEPVVLDWRNNLWKFTPTTQVVGDGSGDDGVRFDNERTAAPDAVGGSLTAASFNVLNYFTTLGTEDATCVAFVDRTGDGNSVRTGCEQRGAWDGQDLARQQEKIVAAINALDADVVGLMEIENSAKLGEPADEATATLVAALNAAAGSAKWAYIPSSTELPPVAEMDVITNAIIYQPAAATPVGASRALGHLSAEDEAFGNAREPIAQVFRPAAGGDPFLFVVNHFKSKGSPGPWDGDADQGDGQGAGNVSRTKQAVALRDWIPTIQGDVASVVLAGDFNSYGQEDPLVVLFDAGYVDVEQHFGIDTSSYLFSGLVGSLDHVLVNGPALDRARGADIWNINSGESIALEYSRYNYHGTLFHAPDAYRSSDHDPVIVGLTAKSSQTSVSVPSAVRAAGSTDPVPVNIKVSTSGEKVRTGTVEVLVDGVVVATAPVNGGGSAHVDLVVADLAPGTHEITARYTGTDSVGASTSLVAVLTVTG